MSSLTEPLFLPFLHQTVCKQLLTTSIPFSLTKLMTFEVNFTRELETAPWFDSEYKQLIIKRRKAQKQWIKSLLDSDKTIYYNLRQKCIELASSKESGLYKSQFDKYNHSQKSLFYFADVFLDRTPVLILPPSDSLQTVIDNFNTFFTNKINDIRSKFHDIHNPQLKATYETIILMEAFNY